ncbi:hypothetical protein DFH08DRAFT_814618 [Mycena albidolilacea]|uniref:Uncharacterized protein n=1 Tax=Mycena albidolilacea TaxID=1033008 RepID=A0AAD7ELC2_9AGAR|nr:hypothetical protein DFH08DRAFT_814618 [Mycena albidolilacea]
MDNSSGFNLDFTEDSFSLPFQSTLAVTLESFIPNFSIPPFHSGSTYTLPPLPPPMSSPLSMAYAVPAEPITTQKRKAKELEVDERDIIAGGRGTRSWVKSQRAEGKLCYRTARGVVSDDSTQLSHTMNAIDGLDRGCGAASSWQWDREEEKEKSSSLIDSKMGRPSRIWDVQVNQKVGSVHWQRAPGGALWALVAV